MLSMGTAHHVCISHHQRAAEQLEIHTWVYILVTITVYVSLGNFRTMIFSFFPLLFPTQASCVWDQYLGQMWRSVFGLSLPSFHPLSSSPAPHLCWHPQSFLSPVSEAADFPWFPSHSNHWLPSLPPLQCSVVIFLLMSVFLPAWESGCSLKDSMGCPDPDWTLPYCLTSMVLPTWENTCITLSPSFAQGLFFNSHPDRKATTLSLL